MSEVPRNLSESRVGAWRAGRSSEGRGLGPRSRRNDKEPTMGGNCRGQTATHENRFKTTRYAGVEHVYVYDLWTLPGESQKEQLEVFVREGFVTYFYRHTRHTLLNWNA